MNAVNDSGWQTLYENVSIISIQTEVMMKQALMVLAIASVFVAGTAHAESGADVVKAKGCLNCHALDKKKVGPAYKDIAVKHKGNKDAEAKLIQKLKEGKGHMKTSASDAELKAAIEYVLSVK